MITKHQEELIQNLVNAGVSPTMGAMLTEQVDACKEAMRAELRRLQLKVEPDIHYLKDAIARCTLRPHDEIEHRALARRTARAVLRMLGASLLLLLVGCKQPPPASPPWAAAAPVAAEQFFGASMTNVLLSLLLDVPTGIEGNVRVIYQNTCCQGPTGNPIPIVPNTVPRAGQRFIMDWLVELGGRPLASHEVAMLCSLRPQPAPLALTSYGAPGCWLGVHPDFTLVPVAAASGLLTRDLTRGIVRLDWVPNASMAGTVLWAQLLVRRPSGYVTSPVVELTIGSQ